MIQKSSCCKKRNNYFLFIYTIFVIKLYILRKFCKMNNLKPGNLFLFILFLRTFHYSIKKIMSRKHFLFPFKQFFVREIYKIIYHIRCRFVAAIEIPFLVVFLRYAILSLIINIIIIHHVFIIMPNFLQLISKTDTLCTDFQIESNFLGLKTSTHFRDGLVHHGSTWFIMVHHGTKIDVTNFQKSFDKCIHLYIIIVKINNK